MLVDFPLSDLFSQLGDRILISVKSIYYAILPDSLRSCNRKIPLTTPQIQESVTFADADISQNLPSIQEIFVRPAVMLISASSGIIVTGSRFSNKLSANLSQLCEWATIFIKECPQRELRYLIMKRILALVLVFLLSALIISPAIAQLNQSAGHSYSIKSKGLTTQ